jgi:hypothetical protein
MYTCSNCHQEVIVDHINPVVFGCGCVGATVVASVGGHASGGSSMGINVQNNNLSDASALVLRGALFAITAEEFFNNEKSEVKAIDIRVKDSGTGREFSYTISGKPI